MSTVGPLYSLADGFRDLTFLLEAIDANGLDAHSERMISNWLANLEGQLTAKFKDCGKYIRIQEVDLDDTEKEIERLRVRAGVLKRRVARMLQAMRFVMEQAQLQRVEAGTFVFSIDGNGGVQPLEVDDVDALDVAEAFPDFVVTTTTINNDAVRKHLEAGGTLPFARLLPRGTHLKVK
jgi:hypothetical protein